MSAKMIVIAAATALTALFGAAGGASAHKSGGMSGSSHFMKSDHDHDFHHGPRFRLIVGPSYGCGYYYEQWMDTGSYYWKRKYYVCKGWW